MFSYVAAGHKKKEDLHRKPRSESMSPRGARYSSLSKWLWSSHINLPLYIRVIFIYFFHSPDQIMEMEIEITSRYLFLLTVCCKLCFSEIYITLKLTIIWLALSVETAATVMISLTIVGRRRRVVLVVISRVFILHSVWNTPAPWGLFWLSRIRLT